jgi:hypothetical protein
MLAPALALGQTLETPVSFDSNGKILEWTRKLEIQAGLFPEVADFKSAVLWKADTLYTLEITTGLGRMRKPLPTSGYDTLKLKVDNFLTASGGSLALNQEGRGAYLLWQIPLSLGWYGPAVLGIVQPDEFTTGAGLYLASASASYFIPFMITNNKQVTSGQEHLSIAGGFRGITAGMAISNLLDMEDSKGYFATMLATSISGQIAGYHYGKYFTKPQARMISNYATFGMIELPLASVLFKTEYETGESFLRAQSAYLLAGMAGGAYLGYKLAYRNNYSDGQPAIIATAGWTGLVAGAGAYFFLRGPNGSSSFRFSDTEAKPLTFMALATSATGLYFSHKYTNGYTFSRGDGYIVMGSTAAGGLLGCGLGFLLSPTGESESNDGIEIFQTISGLSSLGMIAGFTLGLHSVRNQNHKSLGSLDINFDGLPLGLALAASKTKTKIPWITGSF